MSYIPVDELLHTEQEHFSIAKIDETIARSKRIVQESLALSKNTNQNSILERKYSPNTSNDIDESLRLDLSQFKNNKGIPLYFGKELEQEDRIQNFDFLKENMEISLSENSKYLNNLESQSFSRNKEIFHLQNILKSQPYSSLSNVEEELGLKKQKIKKLSDKITNHSLYKENQEIKSKIKHYQNVNLSKIIKSKILEERHAKESLETQYGSLYQAHHSSSKSNSEEIQSIKSQIKNTERAHQRTITFLTNKLEEKMLDNKLILDQQRISPAKYSEPTYRIEESTFLTNRERSVRKDSKVDFPDDTLNQEKRIMYLEEKLKQTKLKYKQLKKLYLKKCRRVSSIEINRGNKLPDKIKKKSVLKRKASIKTHDKCSLCSKRNITPGFTPH